MTSTPDYDGARAYVWRRLKQGLAPSLTYHNLGHTFDDVLPAAERLAKLEGVEGQDLLLLRTAALFHDFGYLYLAAGHEEAGIHSAQDLLPLFGYSDAQIETIAGIIRATRLPQSPATLLEQIMADADLDVMGRDDFWPRNSDLRKEVEGRVGPISDLDWYTNQANFIGQHSYFTRAARLLRSAEEALRLEEMRQRLQIAHDSTPHTHEETEPVEHFLSLEERVTILRSVSIFSEVPSADLAEIGAALHPVELEADESIFQKGEEGDCMYVIASGRIRIHDGEMLLNYLNPADAFGEMAILDAAPRVASATADEQTQLLRLDQGTFYEVMGEHPEVARSVLRVINRYLRSLVRDKAEDFRYIQQVQRITSAAAALEEGVYMAETLHEVTQRTDELGQLARVFQRMANEVKAREERLKREVELLRIEIDEVKKNRQVAEITDSEYFKRMLAQVETIKKRKTKRNG